MPYEYDAVRAYATVGEICDTLRVAFSTCNGVAVT